MGFRGALSGSAGWVLWRDGDGGGRALLAGGVDGVVWDRRWVCWGEGGGMRGFWFGRGGEGLRGEEVEGGVGMGDVGSMRWSVGEGGPERRWTWRFDWRDGWTWLVGDLAGEGKAVLDDRRGKRLVGCCSCGDMGSAHVECAGAFEETGYRALRPDDLQVVKAVSTREKYAASSRFCEPRASTQIYAPESSPHP